MENIIKKEGGVQYAKGFLSKPRGDLVLTSAELYFGQKEKRIVSIPISSIVNVRVSKGVGHGTDLMRITYKDNSEEKTVKFLHLSFVGMLSGDISRIQQNFFSAWEQAIENLRQKKN